MADKLKLKPGNQRNFGRNPYTWKVKYPSLKRSWLCFIDILGFKEIITLNDESKLRKLHKTIINGNKILSGHDNKEEEDQKKYNIPSFHFIKSFTDNIVIGIPVEDDGELEFGVAVRRLADFQLSLVLSGFFIRGGLAFGLAYVDDYAVYGEALVAAYKGENELARDPRIIVTGTGIDQILSHLKYYGDSDYAPHNTVTKIDLDGQVFIDYLESTILDPSAKSTFDIASIKKHRKIVIKNLKSSKGNPKIWSKYEWVARYHNTFCQRYPAINRSDFFINIEKLRGSITTLSEMVRENATKKPPKHRQR
ncbi:hypothetical protein [Nitrospirillum pindoramense]|uniref:Uncharacterized protein n=1 Tax=Nitrospirillum amazonense TaxID=28077 RepID=A0A560HHC3_9PROT|nr:hypothetical protein [Nitrospirillum amazonense]TWB45846.1 hypothetical protein FBZ90_101181 [Nitrospirillum amazonense]